VECIALATAPLIAGAIAEYSSWRVCFYASVPLGAIPILAVSFFLRLPKTDQQSSASGLAKLRQLDLVGMALFVPLMVCFVLALQCGGTEYPWNSKQVIVLLSMTGVLMAAFVAQQAYMKDKAMVPARLLRSRIFLFSVLVSFATSGALYVFTFYVSLPGSGHMSVILILSSSPFTTRPFEMSPPSSLACAIYPEFLAWSSPSSRPVP